MKISIMFGGSCALPPEAIGAIEILWFNIGKVLAKKGHVLTLIGKGGACINRNDENFTCRVFEGFSPTGRCVTLVRAFLACLKMFHMLETCDVLVVNNVWATLLSRFFRRRFRLLVNNVQRMPKGLFAFRNVGADLYVCPSREVARRVREAFHGKFGDRIIVIPNPVDVSQFYVRGDQNEVAQNTIVYHGRINEEKGLHILAKAVAIIAESCPSVRLKMIGAYDVEKGGSGLGYMEKLNALSGSRIDWVDAVADRGKLAKEISGNAIYCYPSVAENGETFGVAPLEAMSLGMPVIVSSLRCFNDFVKDEETGLVFDHNADNPEEELAKKILRVLSDDGLRDRLARNAHRVAQQFSTECVAKLVEDAFNMALQTRGAP